MAEEKKLQTKILKDLESFGKYCEAFKLMKINKNGEPDIFFTTALTGAVLVEAKREAGNPRKNQESKLKKLALCGTPTFVCRTWDDWIALKKRLRLHMTTVRNAHETWGPLAEKEFQTAS